MKGIIFNLLEDVVTKQKGDQTWDALLEHAGVEGAYSSLATYPDEELMSLIGSASTLLSRPVDDVVRWFGAEAIPLLAERYPVFFEDHESTPTFLLTLNDIIHAEVRKLYPGAELPYFEITVPEQGVVTLGYTSGRRLCSLAEGFIEGAANYFDEDLDMKQDTCMKRGDAVCLLMCTLTKRS